MDYFRKGKRNDYEQKINNFDIYSRSCRRILLCLGMDLRSIRINKMGFNWRHCSRTNAFNGFTLVYDRLLRNETAYLQKVAKEPDEQAAERKAL